LPAAVKAAKSEERKICETVTEKVKAELALVTRGLEREQVQRRAQKQAAEEREQHLLKEVEDLKK
jgi:hypothetical protein